MLRRQPQRCVLVLSVGAGAGWVSSVTYSIIFRCLSPKLGKVITCKRRMSTLVAIHCIQYLLLLLLKLPLPLNRFVARPPPPLYPPVP